MISMIFSFFSDLFYWLALGAMLVGVLAFILSYAVKLFPMLGGYGLGLQVIGVILALLGNAYVCDRHGYQRRVAEDKAEIERLNTEARAKEVELNKKLAKASDQLKKAKNDIKTKTASINSRIDSGELRLPSTCSVQASASTASGDGTAGPESDRQTLKAIVQIAADGDSAIVSYNSCIARYNQVMQTVNEGVK